MHVIAERVGLPLYRMKREMPISEFWQWLVFFEMQVTQRGPPDVDVVGLETMAAGLGVMPDGR